MAGLIAGGSCAGHRGIAPLGRVRSRASISGFCASPLQDAAELGGLALRVKVPVQVSASLKRFRARDNFNKLFGDLSLARAVVKQRQLANHITGVAGCIVHSRHARTLL